MKLKIALISLICVLILFPVVHGAISIYKDLKTETNDNENNEVVHIDMFNEGVI